MKEGVFVGPDVSIASFTLPATSPPSATSPSPFATSPSPPPSPHVTCPLCYVSMDVIQAWLGTSTGQMFPHIHMLHLLVGTWAKVRFPMMTREAIKAGIGVFYNQMQERAGNSVGDHWEVLMGMSLMWNQAGHLDEAGARAMAAHYAHIQFLHTTVDLSPIPNCDAATIMAHFTQHHMHDANKPHILDGVRSLPLGGNAWMDEPYDDEPTHGLRTYRFG